MVKSTATQIQKDRSAEYRYKLIQDNPEEMRRRFQLLCANCNWIKRWENHEVAQYSDEE